MQSIEAVFHKPFEVIQFWASDRFAVHSMSDGDLLSEFVIDHPEPGTWYFQVSNGEDTPFIGDVFAPFLPTAHNLRVLDRGCIEACRLLDRYKREPESGVPEESLFPTLDNYVGADVRDISSVEFRSSFFAVLDSDWGIRLPALDNLGKDDVILEYRPGLPCAAAMVRAVQPILETIHGPLTTQGQSVSQEGSRTFDTLKYMDEAGAVLAQRFDITDLFARNLPSTTFRFEED